MIYFVGAIYKLPLKRRNYEKFYSSNIGWIVLSNHHSFAIKSEGLISTIGFLTKLNIPKRIYFD